MPIQFLVASRQYMQFLNLEADLQVPLDAGELESNRKHAVFLFLENTDPVEYENLVLTAWHDTLGVGIRGISSLIIQPPPVHVPAQVDGVPGTAMVRFVFMTPSAGKGRLAAKVLPSGPAITQSVKIRSDARRYAASASSYLEAQD